MRLARPSLSVLLACAHMLACEATWPPVEVCDRDPCDSTTSAAGDDAGDDAPTFTTAISTTTTTTTATSDDDGTSDETTEGIIEDPDPVIEQYTLEPEIPSCNGPLILTVGTANADAVRAVFDGQEILLDPAGRRGAWTGIIPLVTALGERERTVELTPLREDIEGDTVIAPYLVDFEAGEGDFQIDTTRIGRVDALGELPDGRIVELGTQSVNNQVRCYLRLRERKTALEVDFKPLDFTDSCIGVDLKVGEDGSLAVLVALDNDAAWWVGVAESWDATLEERRQGSTGEFPKALAYREDGTLGVCGKAPTNEPDDDALAVIIPPDEQADWRSLDYLPGDQPHKFTEEVNDCVFVSDTLVLVGGAYGPHDEINKKRDRRTIIEVDTKNPTATWIVTPGVNTQSDIQAVDLVAQDDSYQLVLAGYECDDDCVQTNGALWMYDSAVGYLPTGWPLGALPNQWSGPHDVAWTPAGYAVVAHSGEVGHEGDLILRAFVLDQQTQKFEFRRNGIEDHDARTISVGEYGTIIVGGVGNKLHPAIASIKG